MSMERQTPSWACIRSSLTSLIPPLGSCTIILMRMTLRSKTLETVTISYNAYTETVLDANGKFPTTAPNDALISDNTPSLVLMTSDADV
jgi:hypothetical protein